MTRATAERVVAGLLAASGAVNDTVRVMQAEASGSVFQEYRKRTAEVMATIYLDLIKSIVKDFPDLDPGLEKAGVQ